MKLFQIEEPEGGPTDPDAPGAAIGIDASRGPAVVAVAVGGNAVVVEDRAGFELMLTVPGAAAGVAAWRTLFEGARLRAERALARPVTHAVVAAGAASDAGSPDLVEGARQAGIEILRVVGVGDLPRADAPALAAAILAEDLAPRPDSASFR
ncbi:MAG TPA: hypothetical protein VGF34_18830 [Stellaceae bacterium]